MTAPDHEHRWVLDEIERPEQLLGKPRPVAKVFAHCADCTALRTIFTQATDEGIRDSFEDQA